MSTQITFEEALAGLEKAIAAKGPEYVYRPLLVDETEGRTACMYFEPDTGAPSCIVGHVLADHGFTLESVGAANSEETVKSLSARRILSLDERTETLLWQAQSRQDSGITWGEAVEHAKATVAP